MYSTCWNKGVSIYMDVSENSGTPKSSIVNRVFHYKLINQPFWGTPIFGNIHTYIYISSSTRIGHPRHWKNLQVFMFSLPVFVASPRCVPSLRSISAGELRESSSSSENHLSWAKKKGEEYPGATGMSDPGTGWWMDIILYIFVCLLYK